MNQETAERIADALESLVTELRKASERAAASLDTIAGALIEMSEREDDL